MIYFIIQILASTLFFIICDITMRKIIDIRLNRISYIDAVTLKKEEFIEKYKHIYQWCVGVSEEKIKVELKWVYNNLRRGHENEVKQYKRDKKINKLLK